jgi:rhodanese-related sulfurtransferase
MGQSQSIQKINFEDIQYILKNKDNYILINTLNDSYQDCLIIGTIGINKEVEIINNFIRSNNKNIKIVIYGLNSNDEKIYNKCNQLSSLGFYDIYVYPGGMFEWLMLQDIYGEKEFPTTKKENDILKYKPPKILGIQLLEY